MEGQSSNINMNTSQSNESPVQMPFDNDVTMIYKWAYYFNVPVKLIVVRPRLQNVPQFRNLGTSEWVFENLIIVVQLLYNQKVSLENIYNSIVEWMPGGNINADDVAMAYLRVMNDNQIKREDELVIMNNFYYIV